MIFEDLNTYDGKTTEYPVCNESISTWRQALDGVSVKRAAGICSGGEVSFFSLLRCVTGTVDLIDHSYASMYYAIGKYHTIEKLGAEEAHKVLSDSSKKSELSGLFEEANKDFPTHQVHSASSYRAGEISAVFKRLSQGDLEDFRTNREKITFVHGDLNDLIERGPYDLVYLSNALDYTGRNGGDFKIEKMVRPGGLIAFTHAYYSQAKPRHVSAFDDLFSSRIWYGIDDKTGRPRGSSDASMDWEYKVCKAPH